MFLNTKFIFELSLNLSIDAQLVSNYFISEDYDREN